MDVCVHVCGLQRFFSYHMSSLEATVLLLCWNLVTLINNQFLLSMSLGGLATQCSAASLLCITSSWLIPSWLGRLKHRHHGTFWGSWDSPFSDSKLDRRFRILAIRPPVSTSFFLCVNVMGTHLCKCVSSLNTCSKRIKIPNMLHPVLNFV